MSALPRLLVASLLLTGCNKVPPTGQVIASVGGDDVTRRDLAAELQAGSAPWRSDAEMRGPVLQQIVDRKLLNRIARRKGLDQTPDYLAFIRRAREQELARLLSDQIAQSVPPPSNSDIETYLRDHRSTDRAAAVLALEHDELGKALARAIEAERKAVPVRYQSGFGPAAE